MNKAVQQLIDEVNRKEITVGELLTIEAMYPPHHNDPYLNNIRHALSLIKEGETLEHRPNKS